MKIMIALETADRFIVIFCFAPPIGAANCSPPARGGLIMIIGAIIHWLRVAAPEANGRPLRCAS